MPGFTENISRKINKKQATMIASEWQICVGDLRGWAQGCRKTYHLLKQSSPKQSSPAKFIIMPSIQNFILFLIPSDLNPMLTEC